MNRATRLKITELNPHLICVLCGGYYIDATTLVECLHTFCKSCIVNYLQTCKYCPVCSSLVHKTKPLLRLRADTTLQDLVYKLVPGLFQDEMRRRRKYYKEKIESGEVKESSLNEKETQGERVIFSKDELISLALQLSPDGTPPYKPGKTEEKTESVDRRYLLCPGSITVRHLKKFLRMKYNLCDRFQIDVFHTDEALSDTYTLIDIAYIYLWRRQGPLRLYYTVYQNPAKRFKAEEGTVISAEKHCSGSVKTEHDVEYFGISEPSISSSKDIDVDTGNGSMINESKTVQLQECSVLESSGGTNVKFNASDVGESTNEVEAIANVDTSNICVGFNSSQTSGEASCIEASENVNSLEISADGSSLESCTDHNSEQPLIMDLEFSPEEQISDPSVETPKSNADCENNCIHDLKETDKAASLVPTEGFDKETVVCDKQCVTVVKQEQIFIKDSEEKETTVNEKKENNVDYKSPTQSLSESSTSTTKPFKPNSPRRDFLIPYNTEPTRVPFYMHSLYSSMQRYTQSAKQSSESSGHRDTEQPLKRKSIDDEPSVKQNISSASHENSAHSSISLARTSQSSLCDAHKMCTSSNASNSKTVPSSGSLTISISSPSQSGEDVSSSTSPSIQSCRSPVSSKAVQAAIISYSSQTQTTPYKSHSKTHLKEKHGRSKSPSHDSEPRHCEKLQLTKQPGPNSNGIWVVSRVVNGEPVKKKESGSSTSSSSSDQTFEVKPSVHNEQKKDQKLNSDKNDSKFKYSHLQIPKYCIGQGSISKQNKASLSTYRAMVHSTPAKPKWNIPSSKQEHKSSPTQFNGLSGQNKAVTSSSNLSTTGRLITASPSIQTTSPSNIGDINGRLYSPTFTHGHNLLATMASHYSRLVSLNNNSIRSLSPMHIIRTIENPMTAHMNSMYMTHVPTTSSFINEQNCLNLSKNAQSGRHTADSLNIYNLQSSNADFSCSFGSSKTSSDKNDTKSPTTQKKDKEKRSIHHIISEITERRNQKEKSVSSPEGLHALSPTGNGQHATSSNGHGIKNGQVDKYAFTDDDEMPVTQPLLHFKPEPFYTDRKGVV